MRRLILLGLKQGNFGFTVRGCISGASSPHPIASAPDIRRLEEGTRRNWPAGIELIFPVKNPGPKDQVFNVGINRVLIQK
jgi:hypothetical protein